MERTEEVRVECRILELNLSAVGLPTDPSLETEASCRRTIGLRNSIRVYQSGQSSRAPSSVFSITRVRKEAPKNISEHLTRGHFISVEQRRRPRPETEVPYGSTFAVSAYIQGDCSNDLLCSKWLVGANQQFRDCYTSSLLSPNHFTFSGSR